MLNFIRNQIKDENSILWAGLALVIICGMTLLFAAKATGGW